MPDPSIEIASLGQALAHLRDPLSGSAALRELVSACVRDMGAIAGGIFMLDEGGANLELTVAVQYPEPLADRYRLIPLSADVPLVDTVKTSTPAFMQSRADFAARYPNFAVAHPEIARNAFVSLPLVLDGRCVGGIALGFGAARTFTAEERTSLGAVATRCAAALDSLRHAAADHGARRLAELASQRLERLHAFTSALAQTLTPAQVADAVIDVGLAATSARSSSLWLSAPDDASLSMSRKVGAGVPGVEDLDRIPIDGPASPILDAVRGSAPVWIESRSQLDERYPEMRAAPGHPDGSFASLPLLARGRCIGALTFGFEGTRRFLEGERALLQVVSWYAAQAFERANSYAAEKGAKERAEDNQRRSQLVADIGMLLASSLDHSNLLADVARAAVPRFADWCVLELADQRLRDTAPVARHADPAKLPLVLELRRRLREVNFAFGIAAVMRSGVSQLHTGISQAALAQMFVADGTLATLAGELGIGSTLVVPISARGQVLGAMLFNRAAAAHAYDGQDLAVGEDLGRRVGLAVDNARLYQEAREADRSKDEFLAMLSHELRNPLAPIVTALDVMELSDGQAFAPERAMISRNVRHLVRLLDDLLDMSRIARGKIQLVTERCELAAIVGAALEMAQPLVARRAHRLTVAVPEGGLPLIADRGRLAQVIANLVTNAAKYTAPGGAITVSAMRDGSDVAISVRDSGSGIAPELLPRIFDPFVQGAAGVDPSDGGLGLGLAVAKRLVVLHGGTVSAHSAGLGQGSELSVRLPLASPTADVAGPAPPRAAPRPARTIRRVLIVDDNRDAGEVLGKVLEARGCSVLVLHDGAAAVASAATFSPELVLLDIGMSGIDGYEVARRLRASPGDVPFRIVALTGYGQASDRQRSEAVGFDDHIVKPVTLDVLEQLLDGARWAS